MTIKFDIIVTRHPHLIAVLVERGLVDASTPVLTHVSDPEQIRGLHVIGVLPHHLSARAASITEIPMRWSEADRAAMQRGDVGLAETRLAAGEPVTYVVSEDRKPVATPIAGSNLTDLEDLAAAAYSVQATSPIPWADITQRQRDNWLLTVAYLVDIVAPPSWDDQHPELDRLRADANGARRIAEHGLGIEADHQRTLAEIRQGGQREAGTLDALIAAAAAYMDAPTFDGYQALKAMAADAWAKARSTDPIGHIKNHPLVVRSANPLAVVIDALCCGAEAAYALDSNRPCEIIEWGHPAAGVYPVALTPRNKLVHP